jgi:transposase
VTYTDSFKAKMVQRLSAPNAISAIRLSKEVGVSQSQLSRWLQAARTVGPMTKERPSDRVVQTGVRSAEEKLRIVMAAAALGPGELGGFLRREGVHEAELEQWRAAVVDAAKSALDGAGMKPSSRGADAKRIKELERELRRKDKAPRGDRGAAGTPKKSPRDLRGRGRRHRRGEREVILGLVDDAVAAGARRERACLQLGLTERSMPRLPPHSRRQPFSRSGDKTKRTCDPKFAGSNHGCAGLHPYFPDREGDDLADCWAHFEGCIPVGWEQAAGTSHPKRCVGAP